jgi:hypothetical protein
MGIAVAPGSIKSSIGSPQVEQPSSSSAAAMVDDATIRFALRRALA